VSVTTCISDANPLVAGADYFDANNRLTRDGVRRGAADIEFANEFSVHYERYYKVVKTSCNNVQASWDCVPKTYVLRMCGSTAPTSFANGTAFPSGTRHFSVPLQGIATALSPALSFIELLGKRDTLKQVSTGSGFYSPCIQQLEEAGTIRGLHEYGLSEETAWRAAIAADSTVDGVFTDSWDPDGDNYNYIDCADNCGTGATDTDLDIVFDAASDSGGPLGRAEWIKYIALFFNEEDRANAYHKREVEAWTKYSDLAAAEAARVSARTCAWVNSGYYGQSASFTTYKTDYCTAAGLTAVTDAADLALATPTYTTTYADAAAFKAALATFDVIVDESYLSGGTSKADVLSNLGVAESPQARRDLAARRPPQERHGRARRLRGREEFRGLVRVGRHAPRARPPRPSVPRLARRLHRARRRVLAILPRRPRRRDHHGTRRRALRHVVRRGRGRQVSHQHHQGYRPVPRRERRAGERRAAAPTRDARRRPRSPRASRVKRRRDERPPVKHSSPGGKIRSHSIVVARAERASRPRRRRSARQERASSDGWLAPATRGGRPRGDANPEDDQSGAPDTVGRGARCKSTEPAERDATRGLSHGLPRARGVPPRLRIRIRRPTRRPGGRGDRAANPRAKIEAVGYYLCIKIVLPFR